jgi:hypothetical protein
VGKDGYELGMRNGILDVYIPRLRCFGISGISWREEYMILCTFGYALAISILLYPKLFGVLLHLQTLFLPCDIP